MIAGLQLLADEDEEFVTIAVYDVHHSALSASLEMADDEYVYEQVGQDYLSEGEDAADVRSSTNRADNVYTDILMDMAIKEEAVAQKGGEGKETMYKGNRWKGATAPGIGKSVLVLRDEAPFKEFRVNAPMLRKASNVFSTMLSGDWREHSRGLSPINLDAPPSSRRIEIKNFEPLAFQAFLDWLSLSLNISFRQGTDLAQRSQCMSTPQIIRQVLPIANYFATQDLTDFILTSAVYTIESCVHTCESLTLNAMSETRYMPAKIATATDILLAVEASLPEDQVPDWAEGVYKLIHHRIFRAHEECMESYWEWEYSRHKFLKVNVLAHLICKTTTY